MELVSSTVIGILKILKRALNRIGCGTLSAFPLSVLGLVNECSTRVSWAPKIDFPLT
jgi:hypothetical protein